MFPDTSTVEEGVHSSPTSPRNTTNTTNCEAPSSTTSWWQQKRSKIFMVVTVMTVSIALSVGVIVSSRGNSTVKKEVNPLAASGEHDTTIVAELSSSNHPIIGQCNFIQELEAPQPDASSAKVAIDGKNLVVVSRGAIQYGHDANVVGEPFKPWLVEVDEFDVYVDFYSLADNGWEKVSSFTEKDIPSFNWEYGQRNVALSGKIAVVTFPSNDAGDRPVFTYRKNDGGLWKKVSLELPEPYGGECLRETVDVDKDLMVTFDETSCGYSVGYNSANIYRRSGGKWTEAGEITFSDDQENILNVYQVALSGDTLALQVFDGCYFDDAIDAECYINVYKYDRESGTITLQQDQVGLGSDCSPMALDGNYLVHGLSVYHRQGIDDKSFSLQQTFNSANYAKDFGKSLALDNDILVVGSDDRTYIFDLQNGAIGEEFSLDQKPNDTHEISNGILVTSNQDVFGVTIVDCKQPIQVQTFSPTESPTRQVTASPTSSATYCLTEEDCQDQHVGSFSQFVSGNYPYYGCYSKGGILYWGKGGTLEQMMDSSDFLNGAKERILCSS
ncbi:hypothetical protein ACHAXA_000010 [Cyclostephanos tholiformis]|uniref:Uncharacterized protein n=1 Tax=Cyclostephanos tholiformis TaxID=382380 RepID=A0ABD3R731_9STRA